MIDSIALNYDNAANAYDRGRPSYSPEAVAAIVEKLHISVGCTIVDLGAGTGKFTRLLLDTGARLIAIEPVPGMRDRLRSAALGVSILGGVAESIPLADGSADAITAAQSFHWFDPKLASAEIHRVLRSGGGFALIWNRRDMSQPLQQCVHDIVSPYRSTNSAHDNYEWPWYFNDERLFSPLREESFDYAESSTTERLIDRIMSFSYIAALPKGDQTGIRNKLHDLGQSLPESFPLHYICHVFTATKCLPFRPWPSRLPRRAVK